VIGAAKARAELIIEPILNGQWETAEKLKSGSGYATMGDIIEQYLSQTENRPACLASSDFFARGTLLRILQLFT
jgi:hypothetical protein